MGKTESNYLTHKHFPNSFSEPMEITSPETSDYNCLAWSLNETQKWFDFEEDYIWFPNIENDYNLNNFVQLFENLGFSVSDSSIFETGFEKIALFSLDNEECSHVARQTVNGKWTSKLGVSYDVLHTLSSIAGGIYGEAVVFMKRLIDK